MIGKYIKVFDNHSEYEDYITGSSKVLPNISYCKDYNDVHYNPIVIVKLDVTDTEQPTKLTNNASFFSLMLIDGVVQPSVDSSYTFATTGEHVVKYVLKNPTTTGGEAFNGCSTFKSVIIPNTVTSLSSGAFRDCTSLTSIIIPDTVTNISGGAFNNCSSLSSIDIPNKVTEIGGMVFANCSSLVNVNIPKSVTEIGQVAFGGCSSLTSIVIPSMVVTIGNNAFDSCSNLEFIKVEAINPPSLGSGAFNNTNNCPIYVPAEKVSTYQTAWPSFASRIQASV